jgi:hypothetical protein
MQILKNIFVGFLVSFIGSIPLGYLNIVGYEVYKSFGLNETIFYLLGVISIELFVIYFTLIFANKLIENKKLIKFIEAFSIVFMFLLAYIFYSSASKETQDKRKITNETIIKLEKEGKIKKEQKEELLKQTESLINKTHGTLKEDSAIKIFENEYNVKLNTTQEYYKYHIKTTNDYKWYIGGKMDGIYVDSNNSDNNYIVEIKNRTKGFFTSLREYEKTQIQLYLLLTGFKKAKLVEKYNSKIRVTDINIEQTYIDDILEYLSIFINKTIEFWKDSNKKITYLDMNEINKKKFIHKLYLDDIIKLQKHKAEIQIIKNQAEEDCLLSDLDEF